MEFEQIQGVARLVLGSIHREVNTKYQVDKGFEFFNFEYILMLFSIDKNFGGKE